MDTVCVLMVASGAGWEPAAFAALNQRSGVVVLKRCVDVTDLLAVATAGQAEVAVLALEAHGLDRAAVEHLTRHGVRAVAVAGPLDADAGARAARVGVTSIVADDDLVGLVDAVLDAAAPPVPTPEQHGPSVEAASDDAPGEPGRVVAVWGPGGAPGRTTLALALAAAIARRQTHVLAVDADPYGGSVAQHLGITDEVSGVLAAARLVAAGELEARFATVQRSVTQRLRVVTGLPRPDRWTELRSGSIEQLLELARRQAHVVVDTGFSLELDLAADLALPGRNSMTLGALEAADEIVVVGSADPVGLARLARGLVELKEVTHGAPVRVVVNRMRSTLGWSEADISGMVEGFSTVLGLHFLPEDRAAVDACLIGGRTLVEAGDSALLRAVEPIADAVVSDLPPAPRRHGRLGIRRRRAGRARSR
ncbi:ATPase involved in chromosome partitioning [metagenome]|uniref:ATPase involved in chromosome partitioning n=1 Tax=metagenome TaxID=256318 RepID=A0A2P2C6D3_9ZZZZ